MVPEEVKTHFPSPNEVKHADIITPLPGINGAAQTRINGQGNLMDTRIHIKGGQKIDL